MRETTILVLLLVLVACGGPATEEPEVISEEENAAPVAMSGDSPEAIALAELNETCEENWCYGEFDYEFLALECGESTCELFFRAESDGEVFEDSVVFEYDEPLVENGYLEAGNWERVNDAIIDDWEAARSGS